MKDIGKVKLVRCEEVVLDQEDMRMLSQREDHGLPVRSSGGCLSTRQAQAAGSPRVAAVAVAVAVVAGALWKTTSRSSRTSASSTLLYKPERALRLQTDTMTSSKGGNKPKVVHKTAQQRRDDDVISVSAMVTGYLPYNTGLML